MDKNFNYKRVVIKIGSSTLIHERTGRLNLSKMELLVREVCDLRNQGIDVALVSSGAIAVGKSALGLVGQLTEISLKQACAAVGQAKLMMVYQKLFSEYSQTAAQVLVTKNTMVNPVSRSNAQNTLNSLFSMEIIPIVNENDTVSTYEMQFGDNDTLSALTASLVGADLLILLSDIDGLYTDDPHECADAQLIKVVDTIDENIYMMAKDTTGSDVGTGGMATKLTAARIATYSGVDMIIANGQDMRILRDIFADDYTGTLFTAHEQANFNLAQYILETMG
jgi:glutamate 5-kinase